MKYLLMHPPFIETCVFCVLIFVYDLIEVLKGIR